MLVVTIKMFKIIVVLAVIGVALGAPNYSDVSNKKIIGGDETTIEEHPFQVSVQYNFEHFCGGVLYSSRWILTAAHCITSGYSKYLNIRVGSKDRFTGGQWVDVDKYVVHPKHNATTRDNDIALLHLVKDVIVNDETVKLAVLPSPGEDVAEGLTATITGWGITVEGDTDLPDNLLEVKVPTVKREVCYNIYKEQITITDNMICCGLVGGKGSCQGDSGGPVEVDGKIVGLVSFGLGCARPDYPGVYTRVSNYIDWIKEETNK